MEALKGLLTFLVLLQITNGILPESVNFITLDQLFFTPFQESYFTCRLQLQLLGGIYVIYL